MLATARCMFAVQLIRVTAYSTQGSRNTCTSKEYEANKPRERGQRDAAQVLKACPPGRTAVLHPRSWCPPFLRGRL